MLRVDSAEFFTYLPGPVTGPFQKPGADVGAFPSGLAPSCAADFCLGRKELGPIASVRAYRGHHFRPACRANQLTPTYLSLLI
jgi:hypothetical protein